MTCNMQNEPNIRTKRRGCGIRSKCRALPLGLATVGALLAGCATTQPTAREEATERWNLARAEVKAKLAADRLACGQVAAAAGELAEADRLVPDDPRRVPLRARIWLAEGRVAEAADLLERTTLEGSRQAEVAYLLGIARQQQERWTDAFVAYARAADLDPTEVGYVVAAVQTALQLGDGTGALTLLEQAAPRFAWTNAYQAALAECHEQSGNWGAAVAAWQRVACREAERASVQGRLAEALFRAERYQDAVPILRTLLESPDETVGTHWRLLLAECHLALGQAGRARAQGRLVLQAEPTNPRAWRLVSRSLGDEGDFVGALRAARQALDAADDAAGETCSLELVAALAWRTGDHALARHCSERLRQREPNNAVAVAVIRAVEGLGG